MSKKPLSRPEKWTLWAIVPLFLVGSSLHFLFELCGRSPVVGFFAAVNESPWEHLKMVVLPMLLCWVLVGALRRRAWNLDLGRWYAAGLAAMVTALAAIPLLFYFYTGAFGIDSLAVDIIIFAVAVVLGQVMGLHVWRHGRCRHWALPLAVMLIIAAAFAVLSFYPPHIPLFFDSASGVYGIG